MEKKIFNIICDISGKVVIENYDMDLFENGILDSFAIAQLISSLEEDFNIEIDPEDIVPEKFSTISEISRLVTEYEAKK